jgi:hypothetical protein
MHFACSAGIYASTVQSYGAAQTPATGALRLFIEASEARTFEAVSFHCQFGTSTFPKCSSLTIRQWTGLADLLREARECGLGGLSMVVHITAVVTRCDTQE